MKHAIALLFLCAFAIKSEKAAANNTTDTLREIFSSASAPSASDMAGVWTMVAHDARKLFIKMNKESPWEPWNGKKTETFRLTFRSADSLFVGDIYWGENPFMGTPIKAIRFFQFSPAGYMKLEEEPYATTSEVAKFGGIPVYTDRITWPRAVVRITEKKTLIIELTDLLNPLYVTPNPCEVMSKSGTSPILVQRSPAISDPTRCASDYAISVGYKPNPQTDNESESRPNGMGYP